MSISSYEDVQGEEYDRVAELKAFDESKAGVKGLVDAGISRIPKIFVRPHDELLEEFPCSKLNLQVPVIDLSGTERADRRKEIVEQVREACETWGVFQVVNHEIPPSLLNEMVDGVRMFHEQDHEVKMKLYSRDRMKSIRYSSNVDLYRSRTANWRDTLTVGMTFSDHLDSEEIPEVCRETIVEYTKRCTNLGGALFELLSEALGLKADHLNELECARGCSFLCNYYPACPEPHLTLGTRKHTDPSFLTVLLQDQIGGLQFLHQNQWVDVPPIAGSLVVNVGDLLQMISNDKFKSVDHRVLANHVGPRISVACLFTGAAAVAPLKQYGPIKELICDGSPPVYRDFLLSQFLEKLLTRPLDKPVLDYLKL